MKSFVLAMLQVIDDQDKHITYVASYLLILMDMFHSNQLLEFTVWRERLSGIFDRYATSTLAAHFFLKGGS